MILHTIQDDSVLLEFLNQNMHRNYPIADGCVACTSDNVYLPSSFLVDCQILIPCTAENTEAIDTSRFFVYSVTSYTSSVQILIGYQPENGDPFVCAASSAIPLMAEQPYPDTVSLSAAAGIPSDSVYDPLRKMYGTLWIGSTAYMTGVGTLAFTWDATKIRQACVVKNLVVSSDSIVTKLHIVDSSGQTLAELTGTVTLEADESILFNYNSQTNTLEIQVNDTWLSNKINTILTTAGSPIQKINGQSPDSSGNFTISGLDCLSVQAYPGTSSLGVSNTCSKPCCGDESGDMADIRAAQEQLSAKLNRISENLSSFINSINNVETRLPSLVASRK